jgi:hypothetical protein
VDQFYLCHCQRCRKGSGSAHASNLLSSNAQLTWIAGEDLVKTFRLPTTQHTRSFCLECGSALPSYEGDLLLIPAGSLDNSPVSKLAPSAHIYMKDKAEWDEGLEHVIHFDELPS